MPPKADPAQTVCTDCGGTVIEYDAAAGNGFCVQCGTVVEENTIVNEVSIMFHSHRANFLEYPRLSGDVRGDEHGCSNGARKLCSPRSQCVFFRSAFLARLSRYTARARMGGMFGNRGNAESREQTIANGESGVP